MPKFIPESLTTAPAESAARSHLATELFNQMAGTNMTHAPYPGSGAALKGLIGGQIQVYFAPLPLAIPQLKSNRLRGIAVTTAKRSNAVPDMPTVAETLPDYDAVQSQAPLGPKSLPKHIVARWNREINRVLQLPEVKDRMARDSLDLVGGTPERFHDVLRRDVSKWKNVVKVSGIKPEK
jgi:tripartite-type tricarboxylate transporter receptor subunit TctC